MDNITLLVSTGHPKVDEILQGVIGIYEMVFPARVRGYYLLGSYSDKTAVSTSDIDMVILFKEGFHESEEEQARQLRRYCWRISPMRLDLPAASEHRLWEKDPVAIKLASHLVYGEDIRAQIMLPPLDEYVRSILEAPLRFLRRLHRTETITYPLTYPDPAGEFYGYDQPIGNVLKGRDEPGTKNLVLTVLWIATAVIALKAGQYVARKSDCVPSYRQYIHDEWTTYLELIYETCKERWSYLIPSDAESHQWLRALCQQTLAFENDFLRLYREYLLSELHSADESHQLTAVQHLKEIIYSDL